MAMTAEEVLARQIKHNVVIGIGACFALTVLICLPAGIGWSKAVMVAVLPAGFAGPFVGGLISVVTWVLAEQRQAVVPVAVVTEVPVLAPAEVVQPVAIARPVMNPAVTPSLAR